MGLTPDQLTSFSGCPAIDALLIHQLADGQRILFGGDSLAYIDIVNTAGVPDSDIALPTQIAMEDSGYLFSGLDFDALDADLPAGLILDFLTVAKGDALVVSQLADGTNIDSTIGSVFHGSYLLYFFFFIVSYVGLVVKPLMLI